MRLITCGFEAGPPIDGIVPATHSTAFTPLDATNARSGGFALGVSSETGVPDGTSTSLISGATMDRMWTFGSRPFTLSTAYPGGSNYFSRAGFTIRAYVRWNTGNLPTATKAVEFIRATWMTDSSLYGRTALCIDNLGQLHWKPDSRVTLPPTVDVTPGGDDHTASAIVPFGFLISSPLALNAWHMVDIAITPQMEAVRLNGTFIFARCRLGNNNQLSPNVGLGWGTVYSGGGIVTNTGSMGASRKVYFDDLAINDVYDDGHGQDAWAGEGRVMCVRPEADVSADYSWAPGSAASIWFGAENGTLNNAVAQTPHPITPPPSPPTFWNALNNIPMHTPAGTDLGASNRWTGAFSGLPRGYGLSLNQTNPYEDGVLCTYPPSGLHSGPPWYPQQRNLDAAGTQTYDYMVTSGASDWRSQAGVGRLGTFPPGVFHPDTEFIYPRAGGQDKLVVNCSDPATSGTVLLAYPWCYHGLTTAGRVSNVPVPAGEVGVASGLKVWMPSEQSEPTVLTTDLGGGALLGSYKYAPTLSGTPPLSLKRTRSIGLQGQNAYVGAAAFGVYGAGVMWEDQSTGPVALPDVCTALMILV